VGTLFGIAYTEKALASLRAIEPKKTRRRIADKINSLAANQHPPGCVKVQGMSDGYADVYRIRSGDYRALYSVHGDSEVLVLDIGHRKDIYR
jgi:mRNA-degrading endonuclease RelE of RelBE toxin-antitoxin system